MNNICHFELPAKDMPETAAFYEKLFAWKPQPSGPAYTSVTPTEGLAGGIGPDTKATVLYIEVESIPAKLEEIESAGGVTVLPETKIDAGDGVDHGKIALFKDPEGTLMGLWSK
jgi:predicted enzyme related to lactoylglutathione lyase